MFPSAHMTIPSRFITSVCQPKRWYQGFFWKPIVRFFFPIGLTAVALCWPQWMKTPPWRPLTAGNRELDANKQRWGCIVMGWHCKKKLGKSGSCSLLPVFSSFSSPRLSGCECHACSRAPKGNSDSNWFVLKLFQFVSETEKSWNLLLPSFHAATFRSQTHHPLHQQAHPSRADAFRDWL